MTPFAAFSGSATVVLSWFSASCPLASVAVIVASFFQFFSRMKRIIAVAMPSVAMLAENMSEPYAGWTPGEMQYWTTFPRVIGSMA